MLLVQPESDCAAEPRSDISQVLPYDSFELKLAIKGLGVSKAGPPRACSIGRF